MLGRRHQLLPSLRRRALSHRNHHDPYSRKRYAVRLIAFCAGASFYFFLPDASRAAPTSTTERLSPSHFTQGRLVSAQTTGPDSKLLTINIPKHLVPQDLSSEAFAPVWSVFVKDDDIQVERPYTPLEGIDEHGSMRFWIKRYPKGEVGRWLLSKNVGDNIELRGPLKTWPAKEDTWDEIVMISGGTGVTPFCQLFHSLISRQDLSPETTFTLLHSSRTRSELPPSSIMTPLFEFSLKHPDRFKLEVFVDTNEGPLSPYPLPPLTTGQIGESALRKSLGISLPAKSWWSRLLGVKQHIMVAPRNRKTLFLVCGPEPMINAISGPFGPNFSQGPVGGILGHMGFTSDQVRKL